MIRLAVLLPLLCGFVGCGYYTSHKVLRGGDEVKDWNAHAKHQKSLDATSPKPIHFSYAGGAGKEFQLKVTQNTSTVPKTIAVEARGYHGEVSGVTALARYTGGPLAPDNSFSETLATDRTRTVVETNGWIRVSTLERVVRQQPRDPVQIEVWFKVITWFLNGSDRIEVRVLFDGSEIGHRVVQYSDAAPPPEPATWPPPRVPD